MTTLLKAFAVFGAVAVGGLALGQTPGPVKLSLDDAVTKAVEANPDAALAKVGELEAAAKVRAARAGYMPTLSVSETATDSTDPVFAFGARLRQGRFGAADFSPNRLNFPSATPDFMSSAGGSWTLFDSGRRSLELRSARAGLTGAENQTAAVKQNLAFAAVRSYYRALLSDQQTVAIAAAVARAQALAKQAHDRVDAGMALEADAMQADVEVAQSRQEQAEAESNVHLAYADLAAVLGDATAAYTLVAPGGSPAALTQSLADLQASALQSRPALAAAKKQIDAAELALKAAHRAYGPQVNTFANVQADNPRPLGGGNTNWTAGAKIELPILDGGARRLQVDKATAQLQQARASYSKASTGALLDVEQAYYARQNAERQYGTSAAMLQQRQETLRTALDRYEAGLVTISDVLRQQEQLRDLELSRAQALYQWWITDAQLRLATGNMNPSQGIQP